LVNRHAKGQYKACATDIAQQNPTNYGFLLEFETERLVTRKFLLGSRNFLAGERGDDGGLTLMIHDGSP